MDAAKICSDLVKIRTENPPGDTKDAADFIGEILKSLGLSFKTTGDQKRRANIYTDYHKKPLLFLGHIDVVPAIADGWDKDPFSGEISGGFVHGRGSTDMKGGCAAVLSAAYKFLDKADSLPCNLCFVCDEENGGDAGVKHLLGKNLLTPCDCLIAEPTPYLNPSIGQKGLFRADVEFTGEPGHGSLYPVAGTSAIMLSADFLKSLDYLNKLTFPGEDSHEELLNDSAEVLHKILGIPDSGDVLRKITYNPGIICGGEETNIVAQKCSLKIEMRIPLGCRISDIVDILLKKNPSAEIKIIESAEPGLTDSKEKIVKTACTEIERVYNEVSKPIMQWAASDARHLREKGFNAIEYGPGDLLTMHGKNEKVLVESLKKCSEIYKGIMQNYC